MQPNIQQAKLYCNLDMPEALTGTFLHGIISAYSHRAPNKTGVNEDAMAIIPYNDTCGVIAIADGMGGAPEGDKASTIAVQSIVEAISMAKNEDQLRNEVLNGIELANQRIRAQTNGGATTLCVVEIQGNIIRPYHIGDSSIIVTGQRGKIRLRTLAHSPVSYAVEAGMLDESQAVSHPDLHFVSNMVGSEEMRIDVGPKLKLQINDTVILSTDGVSDNFYTEEIIDLVRVGDIEERSVKLHQQCLARMAKGHGDIPGKEDDFSYVIFRRNSKK